MTTNEKVDSLEAEGATADSTEEVNTGSSPEEEKLQMEGEAEAGSSTGAGSGNGHEDQAGVNESISDVIGELGNEGANSGTGAFQGSGVMRQAGAGEAFHQGNMDLLMDVNVTVRAELGKTVKSIEEILSLNPGMLVELDRNSGDNVDLYLNDRIFASGEVTVVDGNFAIRIVSLAGKSDKNGRIS